MKHINSFKLFKEAFKPKRLAGREEEAEKRGMINWLKKAKNGDMKEFDWFDGDPEDVVFDDIDVRDVRICVLMAVITHKDIIKFRDLQKGDHMLVTLYKRENNLKKPWTLTIEDLSSYGNVSKEHFQAFEEAHAKIEEYFGYLPDVQNY